MVTMPPMTSVELRWARAAFGAIFPRAPALGFVVGADELDVAGFLDAMRRELPFVTMLGVRLAIVVCALAPVFEGWGLRTLAALAVEDRVAVLEKLSASRVYELRQMPLILKTFGALLYGDAPAIRARMKQGGRSAPIMPLRRKRQGDRAA